MKKKRLGRGLGSLIGDVEEIAAAEATKPGEGMLEVDIDRIQRGRYQPRQNFDEQSLGELADSIRQQGILQPLVVRQDGNRYELIAGERRWRAAQLAGLQKVPVVVRDIDSRAAAAIALIENIQREDLNPLEEAQAFSRLIEEFDLTHQQVAESVGRSRAAVSNILRLLDLAEPVKEQVNKGLLDMGHARALLALIRHDQVEIARVVVNRGLSVRETEALVRRTQQAQAPRPKAAAAAVDPDVRRLESRLSERLGAAVRIKPGKKGGGQLVIQFHSSAELDGILEHLGPDPMH